MIFNTTINRIPVAKGRPRFSHWGGYTHTYTPTKTLHEEKIIKEHLKQEWTFEPIDSPIKVFIEFYMPIPTSYSKKKVNEIMVECKGKHYKKPDLDNLAKLILDAMNGLVFRDDALICELNLVKKYSTLPRIEITIDTGDINPLTQTKEKKKYNCICGRNFK